MRGPRPLTLVVARRRLSCQREVLTAGTATRLVPLRSTDQSLVPHLFSFSPHPRLSLSVCPPPAPAGQPHPGSPPRTTPLPPRTWLHRDNLGSERPVLATYCQGGGATPATPTATTATATMAAAWPRVAPAISRRPKAAWNPRADLKFALTTQVLLSALITRGGRPTPGREGRLDTFNA